VTELPIVVETSPWWELILGGLTTLASLALGRAVIESLRSGDVGPSILTSAGAALFGPLLQALVAERASQAKAGQDIAAQLAFARANSSAGISSGYRVRNGRGELLR
jgi:hypothetical protein